MPTAPPAGAARRPATWRDHRPGARPWRRRSPGAADRERGRHPIARPDAHRPCVSPGARGDRRGTFTAQSRRARSCNAPDCPAHGQEECRSGSRSSPVPATCRPCRSSRVAGRRRRAGDIEPGLGWLVRIWAVALAFGGVDRVAVVGRRHPGARPRWRDPALADRDHRGDVRRAGAARRRTSVAARPAPAQGR